MRFFADSTLSKTTRFSPRIYFGGRMTGKGLRLLPGDSSASPQTCPERDSSVASLPQNYRKRRNDIGRRNDKRGRNDDYLNYTFTTFFEESSR
jgi:hypothetical protein